MPELPEVETTKASLNTLLNRTVTQVDIYQPKLRWPIPDDLSTLVGYTLISVERRAKYLILTFRQLANDSQTKNPDSKINTDSKSDKQLEKKVIMHLGMSGSLQQHPIGTDKRKHDHLIITFDSDSFDAEPTVKENQHLAYQLHYHDPRRFGAVLWYDDYADKLLPHLGPEPLEDSFNADYLYNRIWHISNHNTNKTENSIKAKPPIKRPIKAVIMDQAFVVGVGNIYATESLFLSGIHPLTPANTLDKKSFALLVTHIKAVLEKSIAQGGSTLKDFTVADGQTGYFQQTLNVYGKHKDPCPTCNTEIEKVTITGRASTFCPKCQPI